MSPMSTTDEDTEEFAGGRARQASEDSPRRRFRVRPNSGGLGPDINPSDPRAIKELLDRLDIEHFLEVQRRGAGTPP